MHIKTAPKLVLIGLAVVGFGVGFQYAVKTGRISHANILNSSVPLKADAVNATVLNTSNIKPVALPSSGIASLASKMRGLVMAWNAQMGLMFANGGPCTTVGSFMAKYGVGVCLSRQDDTGPMQNSLVDFANDLYKHRKDPGTYNPEIGSHFAIIMWDGAATFLEGINPKLEKLGPEYRAEIVGMVGYSRGEDKFMAMPEVKQNPQAARGMVVAGVVRDGDWNIALKWAGDNEIPNNPDERVFDPQAINWVSTETYTDAAAKYVSSFCGAERPVKGKKGVTFKPCVNAVVTWTPGDVNVAQKRGGLVSILSTKENAFQMAAAVIMIKKWADENHPAVENFLRASFEGGDQVKVFPDALRKASEISQAVYKEPGVNADYWAKYYKGVTEIDRQGLQIELGGSAAANLADNLQAFGLTSGGANIFKAVYETFGNIVVQQYPNLIKKYPKTENIFDTSFIEAVAKRAPVVNAEVTTYAANAPIKDVVGNKPYHIVFATGSPVIDPKSNKDLESIFNSIVSTKLVVNLHGHTDNTGSVEGNVKLSEDRAFSVKQWLEKKSPENFPPNRIKVTAHGQTVPVASNATEAGRAQNRRVDLVLGTVQQ